MFIQIYIVDDDIKFAKQLYTNIDQILQKKKIDYHIEINPKIIKRSTKECPIWHFLDIEMPQKNGFEIAQEIYKLDKDAKIIFISDFSSYVFDSYDYHAVNYLLKSDYNNKLKKLINRLIDEVYIYYSFTYYDTVITIPVKNIMYISKHINNVEIITPQKTFIQNTTLKTISKNLNELSPALFCYINKSQIVNLEHVKRFNIDHVVLENEMTLYISRTNGKIFKEAYFEYIAKL